VRAIEGRERGTMRNEVSGPPPLAGQATVRGKR